MESPVVTLISFTHLPREALDLLAVGVQQEFQCQAIAREAHLDLSEFYDPGRRQYNGDKLLREVDTLHTQGSEKAIGIFNVDLFIPILTYIFGQAYLGGRSAIASYYRLKNERYGIKQENDVFIERLMKLVTHELGHTFGLIHCHNPVCVMRPGTYVEDIDQKEAKLCAACRTRLVELQK